MQNSGRKNNELTGTEFPNFFEDNLIDPEANGGDNANHVENINQV